MSQTCTILTEFCGISLGECGKAGHALAVGQCPNWHTAVRMLCGDHLDALRGQPEAWFCRTRRDAGTDNVPMRVAYEVIG